MLTIEQIHTEIEKQSKWMGDQPKQKESIKLQSKRCEICGNTTYGCFGTIFRMPEKLEMKFMLTNDHIERGGEKIDQPYEVNFNFNLN